VRKNNTIGSTFIIPTGTEEGVVVQIVDIGPVGIMIAMFSDTVRDVELDSITRAINSDVFAIIATMPNSPKVGNWRHVGFHSVADDVPIQAYSWGNRAKNYADSIEKFIGRKRADTLVNWGISYTEGILSAYARNHCGIATDIDHFIEEEGSGFNMDGLIWKVMPKHYPEPKNNRYRD